MEIYFGRLVDVTEVTGDIFIMVKDGRSIPIINFNSYPYYLNEKSIKTLGFELIEIKI